jgi:hypothetical protein
VSAVIRFPKINNGLSQSCFNPSAFGVFTRFIPCFCHDLKVNVPFQYEENNQQNALIVSLINLLISNYSNMLRPLS